MRGRTSNPLLGEKTLNKIYQSAATSQSSMMTINGTVNKMIISLLLVFVAAFFSWNFAVANDNSALMYVGAIGGFILAMVTSFKVEWAAYTTPLYALFEGVFLGSVSAYFNAMVPGIVFQAVVLTFGVAFAMLFAYRVGWIRATGKFKRGLMAAMGGILIFYLVSMISRFWGDGINLGVMGLFGIGIQLFILIVAALNLVLDFDIIENLQKQGAPKVMEWYGAFSLMVTLVWLYLEILRFLSILSSRD